MPSRQEDEASGGSTPALVLCGDWALDSCGVGSSEAAMVSRHRPQPHVVDPASSLRTVRRAVHRATEAGQPTVLVYPSQSTVARSRPLAAFGLAAASRRADVRIHLHEYRVFRELRWALDVIGAVGRAVIVVSSVGEAEVLRRSIGARLGRVRIEVIPPANAATPQPGGAAAVDATATGVVGVFGFHRPDKGTALAVEVLQRLPATFTELDTVGLGWESADWPADVRERFAIVDHGPLATAELPQAFARWQLAVASFAVGATDGRNSLRSPLAHGIPTLTNVAAPADLTLRPEHLVVADDLATAVPLAVELSRDRDVRRRGAAYVSDFEQRSRTALCAALFDPRAASAAPP